MYLHYIVHAFTCTSMHAHASVVKYIGVAYENSRRLACRLEGKSSLGPAFALTVFAKKPMCAVAIAIYEPVPAH